jgi:hypothetical protein
MNLEFPKYDLDETADKIIEDDEQHAPHSGSEIEMKKKSHNRGFSFNPSPKSVVIQQDKAIVPEEEDPKEDKQEENQPEKAIIPDDEDVLEEGGEASGYHELEQTTQNHVGDQTNNFLKVEDSKGRISKGPIIDQSPRDSHRALIKSEVYGQAPTVNLVKKYNRQLRKIENADGKTFDLAGDLYSYSVIMMMNPNV